MRRRKLKEAFLGPILFFEGKLSYFSGFLEGVDSDDC
jgi:hypothetical protein